MMVANGSLANKNPTPAHGWRYNIMIHDRFIPLWPDGCPHNDAPDRLMDAGRPALRYFHTPERNAATKTRAAVIICPGGGYGNRARHEGDPFASLLNLHGIEAFVLDYRIAPHRYPGSYSDTCRAIRLVRSMAAELNIDPNRVGLMGFSAGGHLAATVATQPTLHVDEHDDLAGEYSAKPDRVILGYPVISGVAPTSHQGSFHNLLGKENQGSESYETLRRQLSNELHVTADAPPAFVFQTASDTGVPPQNALSFAMSYANAGVKCELHVFEQGGHGLGMALQFPTLRPWTELMMNWLAPWTSSEK